MAHKELKGIVVPVITPVDEQDRVDEAAFRRVIRRLINSGVHGLFIGGSAGEGPLLTMPEWTRMIEIAYDENNGELALLGGAMETSSRRVVERVDILAQTGYEYYVVNPVYYIKHSTADEHLKLFEYCKEHDGGLELVAYNIPDYSRVEIPIEALIEAGRRGFTKYVKDSGCNFDYITRLIHEGHEVGLKVLTGDEFRLVEGIRAGSVGAVPVCANYDPDAFVRAYQAGLDGDEAAGQRYQERINQLRQNLLLTGACWLAGAKYALSTLGLCSERLVEPIEQLNPEQRAKLDAFLQAAPAPAVVAQPI